MSKLNRSGQHSKKYIVTPIEKLAQLNALVADINRILVARGIQQSITLADITITDATVQDLVKPDSKLSGAITDHLWPSVESAPVFHYTSKEAAESILNSGLFRLSNIAKRYADLPGDFRTT